LLATDKTPIKEMFLLRITRMARICRGTPCGYPLKIQTNTE